MEASKAFDFVSNNDAYKDTYIITLEDGKIEKKRLFAAEGAICAIPKGKRSVGLKVSICDILKWKSIHATPKPNVDLVKRMKTRANKLLALLSDSGMWESMRTQVEEFLKLKDEDIKRFFVDMSAYDARRDYQGMFPWLTSCNVFDNMKGKKFWATPRYASSFQREDVEGMIEKATDKYVSRSWRNGYDCSVSYDPSLKQMWYSEEYKGCGNGHYYLMADKKHAFYFEDD